MALRRLLGVHGGCGSWTGSNEQGGPRSLGVLHAWETGEGLGGQRGEGGAPPPVSGGSRPRVLALTPPSGGGWLGRALGSSRLASQKW